MRGMTDQRGAKKRFTVLNTVNGQTPYDNQGIKQRTNNNSTN